MGQGVSGSERCGGGLGLSEAAVLKVGQQHLIGPPGRPLFPSAAEEWWELAKQLTWYFPGPQHWLEVGEAQE